jgi:hypothetical protein
MSTAALPAVLSALVTLFTTAAATEGAGVVVYDGPNVASTATLETITVGSDDSAPQDFQSGSESQEWRTLGATAKTVQGLVACTVLVQSGTADVPSRRARAFAILALCETALRGDIDLTGGSIQWTGVDSITLRQQQTTDGSVVRLTFSVNYHGRI